MHVEEKSFGVALTPEVRSMVRAVFERTFARLTAHVDVVQVRLVSVREGVECRAVLRSNTGATLTLSEVRPSTVEALLASANGLARDVEHRYLSHGHRSRRERISRRRRERLLA